MSSQEFLSEQNGSRRTSRAMSRALDVDEMANERDEREKEEEEQDQQMPKLFAAPAIIADCEWSELRREWFPKFKISRDLPNEPFV